MRAVLLASVSLLLGLPDVGAAQVDDTSGAHEPSRTDTGEATAAATTPAIFTRSRSAVSANAIGEAPAGPSWPPTDAFDEPGSSRAIDDWVTPPRAVRLTTTPAGAPDGDRVLLAMTGATLGLAGGLVGSVLVGAIGYGACANDYGCGWAPLYATIAAAPITALLTVPAGVFSFGNLGGRGADFGWTLLGGAIGAVPGAIVLAIGASFDGGNRDDRDAAYAAGAALAGVGLITGSLLAFELSSRVDAPRVSVGAGTIEVSGRF